MYFDKLVKGSKLSPVKGGSIGFGVIVDIQDVDGSIIYTICTDFGNIVKMNVVEIEHYYTNEVFYFMNPCTFELDDCGATDDLEVRFITQILKIKEVMKEYLK